MTLTEILLEKYGTTVTLEDLAAELKKTPKAIVNEISVGKFCIPTWKEGRRRLASTQVLADYLQKKISQASAQHIQARDAYNASRLTNRRAG